jgi:hypothetical protein
VTAEFVWGIGSVGGNAELDFGFDTLLLVCVAVDSAFGGNAELDFGFDTLLLVCVAVDSAFAFFAIPPDDSLRVL